MLPEVIESGRKSCTGKRRVFAVRKIHCPCVCGLTDRLNRTVTNQSANARHNADAISDGIIQTSALLNVNFNKSGYFCKIDAMFAGTNCCRIHTDTRQQFPQCWTG